MSGRRLFEEELRSGDKLRMREWFRPRVDFVGAALHVRAGTEWGSAHAHYALFLAPLFALFAALFHWGPELFGRRLSQTLGQDVVRPSWREIPGGLHGRCGLGPCHPSRVVPFVPTADCRAVPPDDVERRRPAVLT